MRKKFLLWGCRILTAVFALFLLFDGIAEVPAAMAESAVLYADSFDADVDGLPEGWSFQANSFSKTASVSDGKLTIDGTRSTAKPTSALLPVASVSDVAVELDLRIADSKNGDCWAGIVLRISENSSLRVKFKSDASRSGIIIEILRSNGLVMETVKSASADAFAPDREYRVRVAILGQKLVIFLDGTLVTLAEGIKETVKTGQIAFCALGCKMQADNVNVSAVTGGEEFEDVSGLNSPVYEDSSISVTPTLAVPVYDVRKVTELAQGQLIEISVGQKNTVLNENGEKSGTVGAVISAMKRRFVPVFVPTDRQAAADLAEYLNARNISDAFVKGSDREVVSFMRQSCPQIGGILDATARTLAEEKDWLAVCGDANGAGAKIVVLSSESATKAAVAWLQKRLMTVWSTGNGEEILLSVLHGVNGVLTEDVNGFSSALEWLKEDKNAMVRPPLVIGHRGLPSVHTENSISGAVAAAKKGADAIELDIYLTTDKRLVILHDGTLDRTTTGKGTAEYMSLPQIREYTLVNGEQIPVLEDFFEALADYDTMFFIEIKTTKSEGIDVLKSVIEKYNMQSRSVMISFYADQLKVCREKMPESSLGYLLSYTAGDVTEQLNRYLSIVRPINATLNPSYGDLSKEFICGAAMRGVTVWPWTYQKQAAFKSHFAAGYYGLTTDNCDWASGYGIRLDAENQEVGAESSSARSLLGTMTAKDGRKVSVTCGYRVLSGENSLNKTEDGKIYGKLGDTVRVVLTYQFSVEGLSYTLYSDPVTVTVKALPPEETDPPIEDSSSDSSDSSTGSESSSDSSVETESSVDISGEESDKSGGCGSMALTGSVFAAAIAICAVLRKKSR